MTKEEIKELVRKEWEKNEVFDSIPYDFDTVWEAREMFNPFVCFIQNRKILKAIHRVAVEVGGITKENLIDKINRTFPDGSIIYLYDDELVNCEEVLETDQEVVRRVYDALKYWISLKGTASLMEVYFENKRLKNELEELKSKKHD